MGETVKSDVFKLFLKNQQVFCSRCLESTEKKNTRALVNKISHKMQNISLQEPKNFPIFFFKKFPHWSVNSNTVTKSTGFKASA